MSDECNVALVHSGRRRSKKAQLRDQIEVMKCQIENLERENEALLKELTEHGVEWKGLPDLDV